MAESSQTARAPDESFESLRCPMPLLNLGAEHVEAADTRGNVVTGDSVAIFVPGLDTTVRGALRGYDELRDQMQIRMGLASSRAGANDTSAVAARVVASGMVLLLLAGCGSAAKEAAKENDKMSGAFTELMKRPNLIQVQDDYQSMFETIRTRLVDEVGVAQWVPDDEPISGSSCAGDVSHLDGAEMLSMDAGMSSGNLPDAKWDQAVAIVSEVAGKHGFRAPSVIVAGPSDHRVSLRNAYDGELRFGTKVNTILAVTTGCHLTQEAHQRGTYLPPKKY